MSTDQPADQPSDRPIAVPAPDLGSAGPATKRTRYALLANDFVLIGIMGVLAACGLIYEYLLAHYAGRVLGAVESTIYTMIGLMIVSMGFGAFAAKLIRDPFSAFAILEVLIAIIGVTCVLTIGGLVAITQLLPTIIADTFNLPPDLVPRGGLFSTLVTIARLSPYGFGVLIGFLIGMEIPLVARVREAVHGQHLQHNVGTIYGADYIGAGVGAALWVTIMLSIDVTRAAVLTAGANVAAGLLFLAWYWPSIRHRTLLVTGHGIAVMLAATIYVYGSNWTRSMTGLLYEDEVIFDDSTRYQHMTVTRRALAADRQPVYSFFINGRLQFASHDEHIYQTMLTYPALALAPRRDDVLIIGGGDGLALRDVLVWDVQNVVLVDLDDQIVSFFRDGEGGVSLAHLNNQAFDDPRVELRFADAFVEVDTLLAEKRVFDVIIIDLPDPSHPDLNRLYSDHFYGRLYHLLSAHGVIVVQSTSPYHAKRAFLSIGKTLAHAGFAHVDQYRQNIPSFGEWGFSIATRQPASARQQIDRWRALPRPDRWLTLPVLQAAFEFPGNFYEEAHTVRPNVLGSNLVYQYHHEAWQEELGLYRE